MHDVYLFLEGKNECHKAWYCDRYRVVEFWENYFFVVKTKAKHA